MSDAAPSRRRRDPAEAKAASAGDTFRKVRTDAALAAGRVALLGVAGLIEGLLLAQSPVLERYAAVRLGPDGVLVDVDLLCAAVLGVAGALSAFATWAQVVFLGLVVSTASWSLAESSQHPFWIFTNKGVWRPHDPSTGTVVAHVLAIACVCMAALAQALQDYRSAARAQGFSARALARDSQRLLVAGVTLLGVTAAVMLPVVALLHGASDDLAGAVKGKTAFTLLVGSALLLLVGLGLLATQGRARAQPPTASATEASDP